MKMTIHKVTIFLLFYPFPTFAQSIQPEIPVQTQPLQGAGVHRVGSAPVPIPIQSIEPMVLPSITIQRPEGSSEQPTLAAPKKLPYDTTYMTGRVIYLNGVNISSVKNQDLENVNIHIDGNGNLFIEAPHYEIGVEQSYHPLMPSELPKFPKTEFRDAQPLPNGVYSKETGKLRPKDTTSNLQKEPMPVLPKEFAPEVPVQDQTPYQSKAASAVPASENSAAPDSKPADAGQAKTDVTPDSQQQPKK